SPELLFSENETNSKRLFGVENSTPYVKDGINEYVVRGVSDAVNPAQTGTKAAAVYRLHMEPGASATLRLRLTDQRPAVVRASAPAVVVAGQKPFGKAFEEVFAARLAEADEFYARRIGRCKSVDATNVQRQAFAGMLWSKQFYHYDLRTWLEGDPAGPVPPAERRHGRNRDWPHLYNADIISMPDKWEYPWYAAWDLAFHS